MQTRLISVAGKSAILMSMAVLGSCTGGEGESSIGETCQEYLDCAETAVPDDYATLVSLYGEESNCWTNEETSDVCEETCDDALDDLPSSCEDLTTATHPLIPEEYQYIWDTDGCTTQSGGSGASVYRLAEGEATDETTMTMTETWYWLFGDDWEDDCADVFEVELEYLVYDYGNLGCSGCDEGWQGTWTLVEDNCGIDYGSTFRVDDDATDGLDVIFLFDTITPSGTKNVDNAMLVYALIKDGNSWDSQGEWARGHAYPTHTDTGEDGLIVGPPSEYDWLGDECMGFSR